MVDESIKNIIDDESFVSIMENSEIEFIDKSIRGALGLAMENKVYLNTDLLKEYDKDYIKFVILHEMCHVKRINKLGYNNFLDKIKTPDINAFYEHFLYEERLADRFATLIFYRITNKRIPYDVTQKLDKPYYISLYKGNLNQIYMLLKQYDGDYKKLIDEFIL